MYDSNVISQDLLLPSDGQSVIASDAHWLYIHHAFNLQLGSGYGGTGKV